MKNEINQTFLQACKMGNLDFVKYLVEEKANIEVKDKWGMTALMIASLNGRLEIVKYLKIEKAKAGSSPPLRGFFNIKNI